MRLRDKVAIITGASSGIGKGIASRFAAEGAHVVVNYYPTPANAALAEEQVAAYPTPSLAFGADVTRRDQLTQMFAATVEKFGRIDIAINNAGIEIKKPFLEATDDEWQKVIGVNLYGAYVVSQLAAQQMVKQGGKGKLIFISSVHEDIPFSGFTSYCASKGGVRMMMRNLSIELAPYKINVNNIAPGAIATPINQAVLDDPEASKNAISEIPWGRFGSPDEVASVAVFLASDDAEYVTGSTYYVDGGLTQQVTLY